MSKLWTDLNNPSLADFYVSSTSDVLLDELQELPPDSYTTRLINDFAGWSIIPVAENIAAFEDADLLEPAPLIPDESCMERSQTFFVVSSFREKPDCYFFPFARRPLTLPYTLIHDLVEPSIPQTRFSRDFSNIKKIVTYVIGRRPSAHIDQQQAFETKQIIPTVVSPEVIIESEEKNTTKDLETAVKIAEETYSTLKAIDVSIEHDPEIVDRKTIRFTLTVTDKPELVLKDEFKFKDKLYSTLDIKTCEQITTTYKWKS